MNTSRLRIIVTGLIAQHPTLGGVAWDYLQYAAGLARLGHDVFYFEDSGEWPYSIDGGPTGDDWVRRDPSENLVHLQAVLSQHGLGEKWAYRFPLDSHWFGLTNVKRREVIASADLLVNVSGTLEQPEQYRAIPHLIYIDSDPVFTQIKLQLKETQPAFRQRFEAHDMFFTFGDRIPDLDPTRAWNVTRQPILLNQWSDAPHGSGYTTVMSWTSYKPLWFEGQDYGQKDVELARFIELPSKTSIDLEVAMGGAHHADWQTDNAQLPQPTVERLRENARLTPGELLSRCGWRVVDALERCGTPGAYHEYITSSKAEWSVAKNGYVRGRSGWFSCRSGCYLAAGRPVIVQDTGFTLPAGEGILKFSTLDQAVDAIHQVEASYPRHARAARSLAEAYFDSDKVLSELIEIATQRQEKIIGATA
jgi:hypothetical protein